MRKFKTYKNKYQLGWDVYDLRGSREILVYKASNKGEANTICELLNDSENLDLIPNTICRCTPVCLKTTDCLYLVKTEKEVNSAMFNHLSRMVKQNQIVSIKNPVSKEDELHNKYVRSLKEILKIHSTKYIFTLFDYFEKDNYTFEQFNNLIY